MKPSQHTSSSMVPLSSSTFIAATSMIHLQLTLPWKLCFEIKCEGKFWISKNDRVQKEHPPFHCFQNFVLSRLWSTKKDTFSFQLVHLFRLYLHAPKWLPLAPSVAPALLFFNPLFERKEGGRERLPKILFQKSCFENSRNFVIKIIESLFWKIFRTGNLEITMKDKIVILKIMKIQLEIMGCRK